MNNLFLIHLGFYDEQSGGGAYECHTNVFLIADSFEDAKEKSKQLPVVKERKMHLDSIQLIEAVNGYTIIPHFDASLNGQTKIGTKKAE